MSLLPIADCLVIEHRVCVCCKIEYISPSPIMSRLYATPAGEPRKLVLIPRKDDELAMDIKTTHTIIVEIPHCPICWENEHNMHWHQASTLVPKRPLADEIGLMFNERAINDEIRRALVQAGFKLPAKDTKGRDMRTDYEKAQDL